VLEDRNSDLDGLLIQISVRRKSEPARNEVILQGKSRRGMREGAKDMPSLDGGGRVPGSLTNSGAGGVERGQFCVGSKNSVRTGRPKMELVEQNSH